MVEAADQGDLVVILEMDELNEGEFLDGEFLDIQEAEEDTAIRRLLQDWAHHD